MKNLDETKVYYLGDLSDEQLLEFGEWYETVKTPLQVEGVDLIWLKEYSNKNLFSYYFHRADKEYLWGFGNNEIKQFINALTLFEQDNNQRIIEIQLRIQELNNEILELDDELRELTYGKE